MKKILYTALAVAMVTGCVKQEYTATTTHPSTCQLTLYTNAVAEDALTFIDGVRTESYLDTLITPAVYSLIAYRESSYLEDYVAPSNLSDEISVPIYLKAENGIVPSDVEDIYYGTYTTKLVRDTDRPISLAPRLATRTLTINLEVESGDPTLITDISSTLSGLSQGWCLYNDAQVGETVSTNPEFEIVVTRLTSTVKLLGIDTTANQILTTVLTYENGETATFENDVTTAIAKINGTLDRIIYAGAVTAPEN